MAGKAIKQVSEDDGSSYVAIGPKTLTSIIGAILVAIGGAGGVGNLLGNTPVNEVVDIQTVESMIQQKLDYKSPDEVERIIEDRLHESLQDSNIQYNTESIEDFSAEQREIKTVVNDIRDNLP